MTNEPKFIIEKITNYINNDDNVPKILPIQEINMVLQNRKMEIRNIDKICIRKLSHTFINYLNENFYGSNNQQEYAFMHEIIYEIIEYDIKKYINAKGYLNINYDNFLKLTKRFGNEQVIINCISKLINNRTISFPWKKNFIDNVNKLFQELQRYILFIYSSTYIYLCIYLDIILPFLVKNILYTNLSQKIFSCARLKKMMNQNNIHHLYLNLKITKILILYAIIFKKNVV